MAAQAKEGRDMGFTGKLAIHPKQVPVINQAFNPSDDDIDIARRVIEAYESATARGIGAITLDGALIDQASLRKAQSDKRVAQRIGLWPSNETEQPADSKTDPSEEAPPPTTLE